MVCKKGTEGVVEVALIRCIDAEPHVSKTAGRPRKKTSRRVETIQIMTKYGGNAGIPGD